MRVTSGWRAVIIQVGGLVHSGRNSGWKAGSGNNLGDKELKGKK